MNKKAILMPETLKIILAVIGIVLLVYLAISIYDIFLGGKDLKQARDSLLKLSAEIERVGKGEKPQAQRFLESPNGWWVIAWPDNDGRLPEKCDNFYCVCICPTTITDRGALDECNDEGTCQRVSREVVTIDETVKSRPRGLKINGLTIFKIELKGKRIILSKIKEEEVFEEEEKVDYDFGEEITLTQVKAAINFAKNNNLVGRSCKCKEDCDQYPNECCKNYAEWIYEHSTKAEIDANPLLVLSLMIQESGCNKTADSGSSFGLMQINLGFHCGKHGLPVDTRDCRAQLEDSETNIKVGVKILRESYDAFHNGKLFVDACTSEYKDEIYYGWEAALRGYNGWGCAPRYPQQDKYVDEVTKKYGVLIEKFRIA